MPNENQGESPTKDAFFKTVENSILPLLTEKPSYETPITNDAIKAYRERMEEGEKPGSEPKSDEEIRRILEASREKFDIELRTKQLANNNGLSDQITAAKKSGNQQLLDQLYEQYKKLKTEVSTNYDKEKNNYLQLQNESKNDELITLESKMNEKFLNWQSILGEAKSISSKSQLEFIESTQNIEKYANSINALGNEVEAFFESEDIDFVCSTQPKEIYNNSVSSTVKLLRKYDSDGSGKKTPELILKLNKINTLKDNLLDLVNKYEAELSKAEKLHEKINIIDRAIQYLETPDKSPEIAFTQDELSQIPVNLKQGSQDYKSYITYKEAYEKRKKEK